ncbi:metalloregulator ArsR/SmtB family transcription factor [Skermania sp. ID1734]|uniref:helix-turn-helix transcriptional regulator n=1 Tax=Skermania sp. ID1734 TaxID=2597516 RepID=UPI002108348B|nr:helix-turn-helix domain-containing protein [Skermania sp. ID1734]
MSTPAESGVELGGRRADVLAVLHSSREASSIQELAERLDLHPNTVRFHLDALVRNEQAERVELPRSGPGRPPLMFRARAGMDPAGPRNYRLLANVLTASLAAEPDVAARATEAGKNWGRHLLPEPTRPATPKQAVGSLVEVLERLGFAPELDAEANIQLRHCPFLEMSETQSTVVCPIHLGIMQGALESQGAAVTVDRLDPFVEPDRCVAHLVTPSA